jgi:large subunit ribosomal protein L15
MLLSNLSKSKSPSAKRVGRGYGSGKGGHTSGRGQKGQNARGKMPTWFEGGQLPLIRRTPFIKGKSRFISFKVRPFTVAVERLAKLDPKNTVDLNTIIAGLKLPQSALKTGVKLIGKTKLEAAYTVDLPASKGAIESITAAAGTYLPTSK